MCILLVKKEGVKSPSKATLQQCFKSNPDGAGFAVRINEKIYLHKGLMTFSDFWNVYKAYKNIEKYDVLIHFRIATHGTVCEANTHPFNILDGFVGAHNGVLPIKSVNNLTDSEIFFTNICKPIIQKFGFLNPLLSNVINVAIGSSKIALLSAKEGIQHFGNFIEEEGVLYSNNSFKIYNQQRDWERWYE